MKGINKEGGRNEKEKETKGGKGRDGVTGAGGEREVHCLKAAPFRKRSQL